MGLGCGGHWEGTGDRGQSIRALIRCHSCPSRVFSLCCHVWPFPDSLTSAEQKMLQLLGDSRCCWTPSTPLSSPLLGTSGRMQLPVSLYFGLENLQTQRGKKLSKM